MYIQALKSLISKFLQVKKMETELLDKGVDKELINYAKLCSKTVIYADLGISNGMMLGIEDAIKNNRQIEYRKLWKN